MARELFGIALSFAAVFLILGVAGLLKKRGVCAEICRKLVHILLSNWIIIALLMFERVLFVAVVPACFVVLNYISYRKGLFSGIEREENNTMGTVWYAVSLLVLCTAGWLLEQQWIAGAGILAMGYGDGLAALIGMRRGARPLPTPFQNKTLEGTASVIIFSGMSVGVVCLVFAPEIALISAFCAGMVAMAAELYAPKGLDNLTLPLCVAATLFIMTRLPASIGFFVCLGITFLVLFAAFVAGVITFRGMHTAAAVGLLIYIFGGWPIYAALGIFFVLGSMISRVGKEKKLGPGALHQRQGPRGPVQVLANAGPALLMAAAYRLSGNDVFLLAAIVSFGAAAADTFSSEVGMLSKAKPVSILTLRKTQRGLSGGVTLLGLCGAVLGAVTFAVFAYPFFGRSGMLIVLGFSVLGSLLDSVLGAALQAKYKLPGGGLTERRTLDGVPLPLASGIAAVNNDAVNFLSLLIVAVLVVLFR